MSDARLLPFEQPTAFSERDEAFMRMALEEASAAAASGDVPVGAVLVCPGDGDGTTTDMIRILACGHNTREADGSVTGHAEINALDAACRQRGSWRLSDCTLYVTLEPCPMCAGAILASRIPRVVCGTKDPAAGAMGSVWSIHKPPLQTSPLSVEYGCLEEECRQHLRDFFRKKREGKST